MSSPKDSPVSDTGTCAARTQTWTVARPVVGTSFICFVSVSRSRRSVAPANAGRFCGKPLFARMILFVLTCAVK